MRRSSIHWIYCIRFAKGLQLLIAVYSGLYEWRSRIAPLGPDYAGRNIRATDSQNLIGGQSARGLPLGSEIP
jgi:hypothetical protein